SLARLHFLAFLSLSLSLLFSFFVIFRLLLFCFSLASTKKERKKTAFKLLQAAFLVSLIYIGRFGQNLLERQSASSSISSSIYIGGRERTATTTHAVKN